MKLSFGLFVSALTVTGVHAAGISANSEVGKSILSQARKLNDQDNDQMAWIANYSLKFQGCHHVYQWNENVDEDNDVRLYAKRLARFRMCPSDSCSTSSAAGCTSDYGDYVIDMATYVNAYYESYQEQLEAQCNNYQQNCGCDGNDDEATCLYNCYEAAGISQCEEFIQDENDNDDFQVANYLACAQWEPPQNNRQRRRLEENDEDEQEEEKQYYIGPYCSGQGGSVRMGVFTDDTCTTFADDYGGSYTYKSFTGKDLPYSETSLVSEECFSCQQNNYDQNENEDQDQDQEVEISEACQTAYQSSGKCEYNLPYGTTYYQETSACTYIDGIQIIREDGLVVIKPDHPNAVATAFIVVFAMAFASMGFYVWYLRTRLGIKSDSLL